MAFKFFKRFWEKDDEPSSVATNWTEIKPLPKVTRTARRGMSKNFRVGKVKHVSQDRTKILVGVLEMCHDDNGNLYEAQYNLWIHFDKEWQSVVSKNLNGKWVVFGFYIQSFRNKDLSDSFENVLTCRFINVIPTPEEAKSLAIDISECSLFIEHDYLKLSNVNF